VTFAGSDHRQSRTPIPRPDNCDSFHIFVLIFGLAGAQCGKALPGKALPSDFDLVYEAMPPGFPNGGFGLRYPGSLHQFTFNAPHQPLDIAAMHEDDKHSTCE
jgi:hypothetical protein